MTDVFTLPGRMSQGPLMDSNGLLTAGEALPYLMDEESEEYSEVATQ